MRVGDPIPLVTPPAKAGVQLGDLAKRRGAHRYCDLSNWAPAFAGVVVTLGRNSVEGLNTTRG